MFRPLLLLRRSLATWLSLCVISGSLNGCGGSAAPAFPHGAAAASDPDLPCGLPRSLLARGFPRTLSPTQQHRPDEAVAGAFTVAVLPDSQYYALCRYPHLHTQAAWLVKHSSALNLKAAIHLGDLTESNSAEEWTFVQRALEPLWSTTPTFLATGNHDYGTDGTADRRFTLFQQYFHSPPPPTAASVVETLLPGDLENAYYQVRLPQVTLGVLVLEWSPRANSVRWANDVLARHPQDRVIVVNHSYLYYDSTRYDWARKGATQEWSPYSYGTAGSEALNEGSAPDVYDGERLWTEMVSKHANIILTLNGHVLGDGTGLLSSAAPAGNVVHQILANYQMLDQGGLGYLRLLSFDPDGATLRVSTYSPSLELWATAQDQQFTLVIDPPLW